MTTPVEEIEADLYVIGPEAPLVDGLADRLRAAGQAGLRPRRRRRPARGVQGLHEGGAGRGRACRRPASPPSTRPQSAARWPFSSPARAVGDQDRRPGRRQGRAGGATPGRGRGRRRRPSSPAPPSATPAASRDRGGPRGRGVLAARAVRRRRTAVPLVPAQDFKRIGDGDRGPNTGGMGAYAPMPHVGRPLVDAIMDEAVRPLVGALRRRGIDYRGVLYAGLMLTAEGPRSLSTTCASATPRPRWCSRCLASDAGRAVPGRGRPGARRAAPRLRRRRRGVRRAGLAGLSRAPADGRRHRGARRARASPSPGRRGHRLPRRHGAGHDARRAVPHAPAGASSASPRWRRPWPRPASQRLRRRGADRLGRACRCRSRHRRRWSPAPPVPARRRGGASDDPALRAARHGGAVHRRRPASPSGSRSSCWPPRRRPAIGVVPAEDAATCRAKAPDGRRRLRGRRARAREGHRPRRGRLRRRGAGAHRRARPARTSTTG